MEYSGIAYHASDYRYNVGELIEPSFKTLESDFEFDIRRPQGKPSRRNGIFLCRTEKEAEVWVSYLGFNFLYEVKYEGIIHMGDGFWANRMIKIINKKRRIKNRIYNIDKIEKLETAMDGIAERYWSGEFTELAPGESYDKLWELLLNGIAMITDIIDLTPIQVELLDY